MQGMGPYISVGLEGQRQGPLPDHGEARPLVVHLCQLLRPLQGRGGGGRKRGHREGRGAGWSEKGRLGRVQEVTSEGLAILQLCTLHIAQIPEALWATLSTAKGVLMALRIYTLVSTHNSIDVFDVLVVGAVGQRVLEPVVEVRVQNHVREQGLVMNPSKGALHSNSTV